jgi:hypothetical protein
MRFEDLETEEDIFWFYMEAINPVGYFDYRNYTTAQGRGEKAEKAVVAASLFSAATSGVYALSGGGAHNIYNIVNASRPGIVHAWAVKQHIWKTVAVQGGHVARHTFRGLPGLVAGAIGLAMFNAGDMVLDYFTDGAAGILPRADFMKFTEY